MLVQIEVREDNDGLNYYCGEITQDTLEALTEGTYSKAFVHLENVFWPASKSPKEEYEQPIDYVVRYGVGDRANYAGDMYIKAVDIVLISPLKAIAHRNGRKLGDLSEEKRKLA